MKTNAIKNFSKSENMAVEECPICFEKLTPEKYPTILDGCCPHKFCIECLVNWVEKGGEQVSSFEIFKYNRSLEIFFTRYILY